MKTYKNIISILFFLINVLGVSLYFSLNVEIYPDLISPHRQESHRLSQANNVYHFLQNQEKLGSEFSDLEVQHLQDVKSLFTMISFIFSISIIVFLLISLILLYYAKYDIILKGIFQGAMISGTFVIVIILLTQIDFTSSFQIFHKIFFPQGNREFSENSNLISLFPESFFIAISQKIFFTIAQISLLFISLFLIKKISYKGDF